MKRGIGRTPLFENLVNRKCRKTTNCKLVSGYKLENLLIKAYRTLNTSAIKCMVKLNNLQKLNYGESSQTPQREFTSESDRHVNEPILSINNGTLNYRVGLKK